MESSAADLCDRVQALEKELKSCQAELHRIQRQLRCSERLHRSTEIQNQELQRQVEDLRREIFEKNKTTEEKTDQEVQTEDHSAWSHSDYYYYSSYANYYNTTNAHEVAAKEDGSGGVAGGLEQAVAEPKEHSEAVGSGHTGEHSEMAYDQNTLNEEGESLAESLRATAEAALSQTGYTYDESSGMYYDHSTGFYYDSETQLYYDSATGIYYYCDVESGRYQFHSRVDLQSFTDTNSQLTKDKKAKKKRRLPPNNTREEDKVHHLTNSLASLKISSFGYTPHLKDVEKIWPPCIRVIVVRSPALQKGSLFIITAVKSATIGRERGMGHTIRIPELGVSKFHAEVYFDNDLQSYVLVDQGSQNGTVINGNQILQPKQKCEPCVLEHGDEVKLGETVLSFHIHPGSDTCDGCEPGQVRAHLRLDQTEESSAGPILNKEEKELLRREGLKQIRVKYGLQGADYEANKAVKNPKYKDRAGRRRQVVGSEGNFQRDDAPASVHVEINDGNKGRKMLEKMGWKKGEGLGKTSDGMRDPIQLQLRQKKAGLGSSTPSSIEEIRTVTQNKKNWEKARERYAEAFPNKQTNDAKKCISWTKESAE
ncbi:angiogenic factor with G patch and FHA domains 1 isoform X2 [Spea bombifrons]|uniref:angiogenic factor with G patch and FHA domains 1 isoform X2 n=1 Tax=Spea bombifrons TaxID=233779 RepID=UPI00234A441E|nr:angiogenic factor with G patch and FHA domains 1 isoform X2 [Spea bombifrons]